MCCGKIKVFDFIDFLFLLTLYLFCLIAYGRLLVRVKFEYKGGCKMTGLKRYLKGLKLSRQDIRNWLYRINERVVMQTGYTWKQFKYIKALNELLKEAKND